MQHLKRSYASAMQGLGAGLYGSGMLRLRTTPPDGDVARWLHSLFAIYDIDSMVWLDLPWWTLRAARLIDTFLTSRPQARVFEYGSGASTVFLARRAGQIISIEHDRDWHAVVTQQLPAFPNVRLDLVEPQLGHPDSHCWSEHPDWRGYDFQDYVEAIEHQSESYDLIVIDGRCRSQCLRAAMRRIKDDGIILVDNAGRRRYRAALQSSCMPSLSTRGLTACLPYPDQTVLLSRTPRVLADLLERQ